MLSNYPQESISSCVSSLTKNIYQKLPQKEKENNGQVANGTVWLFLSSMKEPIFPPCQLLKSVRKQWNTMKNLTN